MITEPTLLEKRSFNKTEEITETIQETDPKKISSQIVLKEEFLTDKKREFLTRSFLKKFLGFYNESQIHLNVNILLNYSYLQIEIKNAYITSEWHERMDEPVSISKIIFKTFTLKEPLPHQNKLFKKGFSFNFNTQHFENKEYLLFSEFNFDSDTNFIWPLPNQTMTNKKLEIELRLSNGRIFRSDPVTTY